MLQAHLTKALPSSSSLYRSLWNVVNVTLVAIILQHASTPPQEVLGRYTRSYALGALLAIALSGVVLWMSVDRQRFNALQTSLSRVLSRLERIAPGWQSGTLLFAVVMIAALLLTGSASAKWIKVFFVFNVGFFGIVAASAHRPESVQSPRRFTPYVVLFLVIVLVGLLSAPAIPGQNSDGDEAGWTNYAVTWLQTGNLYYKIMGVRALPITPGVGYGVTLYARWLAVFGVTFASARAFIWLVHLAAVMCMALAGWKLYDGQIGILSALLAAASPLLLAQRIVRPEIGLPAIGALLLIVHKGSQKRPWYGLVGGWLAVLSLEIHAAGIAYIVGIVGLCGYDTLRTGSERRITVPRHCLAFAAGILGGLVLYVFLHILVLAQPAAFFADLQSNREFLTAAAKSTAISRILTVYGDVAPAELLFFAIGLLGLIMRRRPDDLRLLFFWLFTAIGYLLFVPRAGYYLSLFAPFVILSIASVLRDRFEAQAQPLSASGLALSALFVFCTCGQFIAVSWPGASLANYTESGPSQIEARIRELAKPSEVVVGHILSYWGLVDYPNFYASQAEVDPAGRISGEDPYARWQRLAPDVVFHTFYPAWPNVPPNLARYMDDMHYQLVDTFSAEGYVTKVWRRPALQGSNP